MSKNGNPKSIEVKTLKENKEDNVTYTFSSFTKCEQFMNRGNTWLSRRVRRGLYVLQGKNTAEEFYVITKIDGVKIPYADELEYQFYEAHKDFRPNRPQVTATRSKAEVEARRLARATIKVLLTKLDKKYPSLIDAEEARDNDFYELRKLVLGA